MPDKKKKTDGLKPFKSTLASAMRDLEVDTTVADQDLSGEFASFPGQFSWWVVYCAASQGQFEKAKLHMDVTKAETDGVVRQKLIADGIKITEAAVSAQIRLNDKYRKAETTVGAARQRYELFRAGVEAMRSKKDMLISLGAHKRAEMDSEISINTQTAKDRIAATRNKGKKKKGGA